MLESKNTQFSLSPTGEILWQEKLNNPVPGVAVATLTKGESYLQPEISVADNEITAQHDQKAIQNHLSLWLKTHLGAVIEPLMLLAPMKGVKRGDDPVTKIADKVYEGLGIVSREDIEDLIKELTPETRTDLRAKKIRLGPILVFMPELNKPAAIRLRALLWSIFNGTQLPAPVPADGIVSMTIDDKDVDKDFYRAIGYPLYANKAVRIDMLDRVVSCVYDHAEKGKFQARHEMAEWLGCSIQDLYKVLEEMGHTKVYDPLDNVEEKTEEAALADDKAAEQASKTDSLDTVVSQGEPAEVEKKSAEKPELATFRLKKGKAFQSKDGRSAKGKGSYNKSSDKPHKGHKKPRKDKKPRGPRVISVEAKKSEDDSPFAILQQLKNKSK